MNTKQAIECFERQCASGICTGADKVALAALREKAARENPQPLTLEELRERDGKPVWVTFINQTIWHNGWHITKPCFDYFWFRGFPGKKYFEYGKTYIAYDYPPKEEQL